jgi:ubiquinone/menaquinone biosynthesis C-methylase UbiE
MTWASADINQRTLEVLSIEPSDRVLEIGSGPGDLMNLILGHATRGSVVGVDFSPDMIARCSKRFAPLIESGRVEMHCAAADALPLSSGRFSKACTVNTIYFWPEATVEFEEIRRALSPGGRLVVSFLPRDTMEKLRAHPVFKTYSGDEVANLLRRAGFCDTRIIEGRERRGRFLCVVGTKPEA